MCRAPIYGNTGLGKVTRLERSRRYLINGTISEESTATFAAMVHDRMTEW
jgi:phosphoribosylformylglycinamidine synthase